MSIAWSTVAFLVLLLPGFLFFIGLYLPENFTRETAPRSALGQLAAIVLIAFGVHGVLYGLAFTLPQPWLPTIRLDYLLQLLQVEALTDSEFAEIIRNIERYRWWIVGYVLVTSALGLGAGYETGCLILRGPLRRLAEHAWVYDLRVEGGDDRPPGLVLKLSGLVARLWPARWGKTWRRLLVRARDAVWGPSLRTITVTYILTDVKHDERYLLYRGFLKAFGISKEGKPLYLVLSGAMRGYMQLGDGTPSTTREWRIIGDPSEAPKDLPGPRLSSYLTVSGEHISNVMFDRHVFAETVAGGRRLEEAVGRAKRKEKGDVAAASERTQDGGKRR